MDDAQYNHLKNIYDKGKGRYVLVYGVLGVGLTFAILFSLIVVVLDSADFGLLFPITLVLGIPTGALFGMLMWKWIEKQYLPVKHRKDEESKYKKEQAESERASKKASEERKKELIEKYGEEDGMLIFKRKISEKNYKKKKELIQKYGEKFGNAVFNKTLEIGMSLEMFRDIFGEDVYLEVGNKFYVGKPFKYTVTFENGKLVSEKKISQIWQNMSKNMLVASWGNPENEKETVYKSVVKLKWFYGGRRTRQNTRVYKWRVDLENNRVVGWKELE